MTSMTISELEPERDARARRRDRQARLRRPRDQLSDSLAASPARPSRSARGQNVGRRGGRPRRRPRRCCSGTSSPRARRAAYVATSVSRRSTGGQGIGRAVRARRRASRARDRRRASLSCTSTRTSAGIAFAQALGFREVRAEQESVLDPRTVTEVRRPSSICAGRRRRSAAVYDGRPGRRRATCRHRARRSHPVRRVGRPRARAIRCSRRRAAFSPWSTARPAAVSMLLVDPRAAAPPTCSPARCASFAAAVSRRAVKLARSHWAAEHGVTRRSRRRTTSATRRCSRSTAGSATSRSAARRVPQEQGNGFFASAASTCDVTQTGVVTYFAE